MILRGLPVFALFASAAIASAQGTKTPAAPPPTKQSGQPPATKAPQTKAPATKAADTKAAPPATKAADTTKAPGTQTTGTKTTGTKTTGTKVAPPATQARPGLSIAAEAEPVRPPAIMREVFSYDGGGRRDPFFTLLASAELRPTITDLKLIGIAFDETGRRSVAILRDLQTRTQYRVTTGMLLGRMRVALIKRKVVIFSIEEFGLNRQDSLVIGDSSKVRAR